VRQMIESSPTSQLAGYAAEVPMLATRAAGWLPNEYGGKEAVGATKALENVAPAAAKDVPLLKRMGAGALNAVPGGVLWGGTQFGGTEEDYKRRLTEKTIGAVGGGIGGAGLGAAGAFGAKAMEKMG